MQTIKQNIISVSNLSFAYENQKVLENISFCIQDKEFLAIIGPNGGGKTTLLKLLLGIETPLEGKISIMGEQHVKQTQNIGYVPQNTNINMNFPIGVLEVVMMGQNSFKERIFGYTKDEKVQGYEALNKVGMSEFASKPISSLSGGQRQRVFIARALFADPKILILDEPTSSIDVQGSAQIYKVLKELNEHIPIIVVSHDLSVVVEHATRAFYINKQLFDHNLNNMKKDFSKNNAHICEVELLEMLGKCKC